MFANPIPPFQGGRITLPLRVLTQLVGEGLPHQGRLITCRGPAEKDNAVVSWCAIQTMTNRP
jgi:hypothetical protein